MLSESQARELKYFLWGQLPREILDKVSMELMQEINKVIDKAANQEYKDRMM